MDWLPTFYKSRLPTDYKSMLPTYYKSILPPYYTIVLSVLLRYTDYDYPFRIFKLFLYKDSMCIDNLLVNTHVVYA
jgi:hypothetical protein